MILNENKKVQNVKKNKIKLGLKKIVVLCSEKIVILIASWWKHDIWPRNKSNYHELKKSICISSSIAKFKSNLNKQSGNYNKWFIWPFEISSQCRIISYTALFIFRISVSRFYFNYIYIYLLKWPQLGFYTVYTDKSSILWACPRAITSCFDVLIASRVIYSIKDKESPVYQR